VVGGDVYCWGGSEVWGEAFTPRAVQRGFGFRSLAYGGNLGGRGLACAQDGSRALYCFGYEPHELVAQPIPTMVAPSGAGTARQFDVGGAWTSELLESYQRHVCLVADTTNAIDCWGSNAFGQLGDGSTTDLVAPTNIPQLADVMQITTGGVHSCAVTKSGVAYCWGRNNRGQLGTGTSVSAASAPQRVTTPSP
jgi:hypothetical protein